MDAIIYVDPNLDGILTKWKKKIDKGYYDERMGK